MYIPCEHCGFDTEEHCKDCLMGILEKESETLSASAFAAWLMLPENINAGEPIDLVDRFIAEKKG